MAKQFMKKWGVLIACGILMVGGFIAAAAVNGNRDEALAAQSAKIAELENKKDVLEAAYSDANEEAIKVASGIDMARVQKDDKAAEKLIERVCTWDSKESYDGMRNGVMKDFGLEETSAFVQVFMPKITDATIEGKKINEIDANGLNMEFVRMKSNVIGISGDRYSYLTTVTIQSSDKTGASAEGDSVFMYTVDGKGNLSDLNAYVVGMD
ncbi:MAG: hypothetical protein Q4B30_00850 [Coriobacteriaceae bacterium]|nr:hypothetical protein [Coriobacteriaceae bacterium]